jgi:hypothetical protein
VLPAEEKSFLRDLADEDWAADEHSSVPMQPQ